MKYKLTLPPLVYKEIMHYVDKAVGEISGLGTLAYDGAGNFEVKKVWLCEQENSASTTDLKPESVAKLMFEARDEPFELRFWWHSHVNMGVFWSGTDKDTMVELAERGWFLSTVFNKKREMKTCLTFNSQFGIMRIDDIETVIEMQVEESVMAEWDRLFAEKCVEKKYQSYQGGSDSRREQEKLLPAELLSDDDYQGQFRRFLKLDSKPWADLTPEEKREYSHLAKEFDDNYYPGYGAN